MLIRTPWKKVFLICACGWHKPGWKETKHWSDVESTQRIWFGKTNIFPRSCVLGMYSTTMWNKQRYCWQLQNHVWVPEFPQQQLKNLPYCENLSYFFMVLMIWRVMQRKCVVRYCELANKTTQQLYNVSTPCIDDHHFKEELKFVELSNVCSQIFWNTYTWHVLEDLIFYGQWTNLHDRSQNGPKPVTNDYIVWSLTSITHVNTNRIVMLETQHNSAYLDCFKTLISREISKTQNQHQEVSCEFSEVTRLCQQFGCVRNRLLFHTVLKKLKSFLSMRATGKRVSDRQVEHAQHHPYQTHQRHSNKHWSHSTKYNAFESQYSFVCLWRQWSGNWDDDQRSKSHNEACFTDPQSCAGLVVWQD